MIFCELLNKFSDEIIIERLKRYDCNTVYKEYLSALKELRDMKPSEEIQDIEIKVELNPFYEIDEKDYLYCYGSGLNKEDFMV